MKNFIFVLLFLCIPVFSSDGGIYLPDKSLTPGDTLTVSLIYMCRSGYSNFVRYVPYNTKIRVMKVYKKDPLLLGKGYRIDHLVPLCLGGSNSPKNLWPEPLRGEWSTFKKDKLEITLQRLVCSGKMSLKEAQLLFMDNWIKAYKKYVTGSAKK